jgi:hypothetical protein
MLRKIVTIIELRLLADYLIGCSALGGMADRRREQGTGDFSADAC